MTESQKAFEQHYSGYHNIANEDFSKTDGLYNLSYLHRDYEKWQAAEAYGRKQAPEIASLKAQIEHIKQVIIGDRIELEDFPPDSRLAFAKILKD
jgi:hypothetical protein